MTFSVRYIANIIQMAAQQGASRQKLLDIVGLDMDAMQDEDLRLDASIYNKVLETAITQTGDDFLGLHIGNYLSLSAAGIIYQIAQTSATIYESLEHVCAFANLGCQALPFSLHKHSDLLEIRMTPSELWMAQSPISVAHTIDAVTMFSIREFQTLTLQKHQPEKVHFTRPRPPKFTEYEKFYGCPVRFEQPTNAIFLSKKVATQKIVTSDYSLLQILLQYATARLEKIQHHQGFSSIVKNAIINLVKPQFPTLHQVADNLNLSVRTLQRRLKEEGLTFKMVMDELKKQFALDYMHNLTLSISEIAYLLDYADASAFNRSFKRWTGKSPKRWRETVK